MDTTTTTGAYSIPPPRSRAHASPIGRYQAGATPASISKAVDDRSRSRKMTEKISAKTTFL